MEITSVTKMRSGICQDFSFPHRSGISATFVKAAVLALVLLLNAPLAHSAAFQAWFENGTKKIRQNVAPKVNNSITLQAAKNEFEPFQVVFKNNSSATMRGIDVAISDFTGPGTIPSSNVTIFKEEYLNITKLSSVEGQLGHWPDALLPKVDAYYHEARSTFPVNVEANWVQPFWLEVFVPESAPPGVYSATVTLSQNAAPVYTGTVRLVVWGFALPATSSLPSYFVNSISSVWKGFSGASWLPSTAMVAYQRDFIKAGLRHRITTAPYPRDWGTWDGTSYSFMRYANFDASLKGFLDGTASGIEYGAARITGQLETFSPLYGKHVVAPGVLCKSGTTIPPDSYLQEVKVRAETLAASMSAEQKANTYVLVIDEPGGGEIGCGATNPTLDYNSVRAAAALVKAAGLKVRETSSRKVQLLNNATDPPTNDLVDMWQAYWGSVVGRDWAGKHFDRSDVYAEDAAKGVKLWWYQGCMSGACGSTGNSTYNGNPQYQVEYPATYTRVFPWMMYKYGVQGENYWGVTAGFGVGAGYTGDPYYSLWSTNYYKNGDGMLFYPGVANTVAAGLPAADGRGTHTPSIGGSHNIPIESIRLKMIREGREDYEYLKMLSDLGEGQFAQNQLANIVTTTYIFNPDENQMYSVREQLARRILTVLGIEQDLGTQPPPRPTGVVVPFKSQH